MSDKLDFELIPRGITVGIIKPGDEEYSSSCQLVPYGDMALMHTIIGPGFYDLMVDRGAEIMQAVGVKRFEGLVLPEHLRLMRHRLRGVADVYNTRKGMMHGKLMDWIVITEKRIN